MSLLEQQNLLARLFTDESLRNEFLENPDKTARKFDLCTNDIEQLKDFLPSQLNFFADSLFFKRLQEVEKLLPLTQRALHKDFKTYFREFAKTFQPKTVKKHLEDAVGFAEFLAGKPFEKEWIRVLAVYEQSQLNFYSCHKSLIIKLFSYDPKEFDQEKPRKRPALVVWLRIGKFKKHYIF